jgi:hypothetical protein
LKILHSGRGILPTPSHNFLLPSLFHVPQIQKNLISDNQFTHDNQVFIEFHPNFFCVKDFQTRQLLLKGPSRSGLYPWPSSRDHFPKPLVALLKYLHFSFALKDLGPLNFFLGVEASWKSDGLHLSQQRNILDILKKTNMELVKPVSTPMFSSTKLSKFEGLTITDPTLYRSTVGSLQYLSLTRPDIAFAVNKVSQFMQDPREPH